MDEYIIIQTEPGIFFVPEMRKDVLCVQRINGFSLAKKWKVRYNDCVLKAGVLEW